VITGCRVDAEIVSCLLEKQPIMLVLFVLAIIGLVVLCRAWSH
jgi:hypothetical protein